MSNWYAPARVAVERQKSLRSLVASWSTCDARKVRTQSYHGVKLDTPWRLTFTVSALPWQFDLKSESAHTRQTQHFSRRLWAGELQKAVVLASFWAFLACVGARAKDNVDSSTTGSKQSLSGDAISSTEQRLIQGLFRSHYRTTFTSLKGSHADSLRQ